MKVLPDPVSYDINSYELFSAFPRAARVKPASHSDKSGPVARSSTALQYFEFERINLTATRHVGTPQRGGQCMNGRRNAILSVGIFN